MKRLLGFQILVCTDEGVEACLSNQSQKLPVLYRSPAFDRHGCYRMTRKVITYLFRYTLIKNYPAQR